MLIHLMILESIYPSINNLLFPFYFNDKKIIIMNEYKKKFELLEKKYKELEKKTKFYEAKNKTNEAEIKKLKNKIKELEKIS